MATFVTTRCRNSQLWFVNNPQLTSAILGQLAICLERHSAEIYAFAVEGNHHHYPILFPKGGLSHFLRDFNSWTANNISRFVPSYPGGTFWGRRSSTEILPGPEDLEHYFFYTVLQPVKDGMVERISEYPGYNCFSDAVWGITRKYEVVDWARFNSDKRWKEGISVQDYTRVVKLQYKRLPGYEHLSQKEYALLMHKKLEERRLKIVQERREAGLTFLGREGCLRIKAGALPKNTKTSTISSHRPRVLSICPERRAKALDWYFTIYRWFKEASRRYRAGELDVEFPPGTHKPPIWCSA